MEGPAGGDRAKRMKTRNFYKITKRNETWPVGQWRMASDEWRVPPGQAVMSMSMSLLIMFFFPASSSAKQFSDFSTALVSGLMFTICRLPAAWKIISFRRKNF